MDNNKVMPFLDFYRYLIDDHMGLVQNLMTDEKVRRAGWEYDKSKSSQPETHLNVFEIVSDLYYRENFHSDIIKFFLDPEEKHHEGSAFLFAFIDYINSHLCKGTSISKSDYHTAIVQREQGKIDILISSETSKHCIIIENKLYNAGDMDRQLPRYYDYMAGLGYVIDAIVYLPLDPYKQPDQSGWTVEDRQHVLPLLCIIPAYQKKGMSLVTGWIEPCTLKTKNIDCASILRQYGELLIKLSNNKMDNVILSKFYHSLLEGKSLETALSIKNMLHDLPVYMADRLCDIFKVGQGDYQVWKYKENFCGIVFKLEGGKHYKIDIWTSEKGYSIHVFGQDQANRIPISWAEGMSSLESFILSNDYYQSDFSFYDEEKVIRSVNAIIVDMREHLLKK